FQPPALAGAEIGGPGGVDTRNRDSHRVDRGVLGATLIVKYATLGAAEMEVHHEVQRSSRNRRSLGLHRFGVDARGGARVGAGSPPQRADRTSLCRAPRYGAPRYGAPLRFASAGSLRLRIWIGSGGRRRRERCGGAHWRRAWGRDRGL